MTNETEERAGEVHPNDQQCTQCGFPIRAPGMCVCHRCLHRGSGVSDSPEQVRQLEMRRVSDGLFAIAKSIDKLAEVLLQRPR